jgi:MoaA/NifB/PqqE/SkfB family radical SAM enzyme
MTKKMKFKNKIKAARGLIQYKLFKKKIPLIVTWPLTNKCNLNCKYCDEPNQNTNELNTREIISIIDQLKELGCQRISLSGGEPLIRKDIDEIIDYIYKKNISCVMTSNGLLIKNKIKSLNKINLIKLSIDGSKKINDIIRGNSTYNKVIEASKSLKNNNIKFVFNTVITKLNIRELDYVIDLAEKFETGVRFTVINYTHAHNKDINELIPDKKFYSIAVNKLEKAKRKGKPVLNSFLCLNYLKSWPEIKKIKCYAGELFCHINTNGTLSPCVMLQNNSENINVLKVGFKKAFENLSKNSCKGCWCTGTLELNMLLSLEFESIINLKNII